MLVVSWNLARNTTSRSNAVHDRAWHLLAAMDPDIALLQEAQPPAWVRQRWDVVKAPTRYWGSAILAKPALHVSPFTGRQDEYWDASGYLASATVTLADGTSLFLGSVHAPLIHQLSSEQLAGFNPHEIKLPSRSMAAYYDVPYALFRERVPSRFLVSGDWNVSPILWDEHHPDAHMAEFFERAAADGWVDCYRQFHVGEGRSWFRGTDRPYQMDHAFCDPTTAQSLTRCDIEPYGAETLRLSDHAPLVLTVQEMRGM